MKSNTLFKRVLAMLLAVMMLLTVTPLTAFATGEIIIEEGGDVNIGDTNGELDEEETEIVGNPVSSLEELEEELLLGTEAIEITESLVLDHTLYITNSVILYSETAVTLTRAPEFAGDLFVVGQSEDGILCENEVLLTFGREDDEETSLLTIDGNKDNVTVPVVGSALFVCDPGHVIVYGSVNVINHKKVGNERTSHENVTVSYPNKVGGAAAIVAGGGELDIYGGTFSGNEVNTVADENETCLQGGAIYNYGTLNIYGGTFDGNSAKFGGAFFNYRTMNIHRATISNNTAADLGGAIYMPNSGSAFTYIGEDAAGVEAHVSFIGNTAADSGGAIYARNVIDISNAYFKGNSATSGEGGAIIAYTVQMTMNDVIFDGNTSGSHGSAVYLSGSNEKEDVVELEATKVTFKNNSGKYGALYINSTVRVSMEDAVFENNSGTYGGAIYNNGGVLDINGATFSGNTSTTRGGALYSLETATVTLNNITATGNSSKSGGFAYILNTTTKIYDSTFQNNSTTDSGAVLCLFSGAATDIYNCTFKDNTAANNAGVIQAYTDEAPILIHSSTFTGNTSSGYGGVIHTSSKSQLSLYCITATNNIAGHGGFLYITTTSTTATIGGLTLAGNTATTGGNNIWGNSTGAKLYLDQSKCVENDYAGVRDDAYWSAFVTNKLKTYYQAVEVPTYVNYYGEEVIPNVPIIPQDVTTAEELEQALASDNGFIRLMANITLDRTLYITQNTTIFGVSSYTITRGADFAGDLFVVGQYANGDLCEEGVTLTLGREDGTTADHLIIDGNKDNLAVDVVGSALFVCKGAIVNLTKEVTLQNHKKVGNQRTSHENVTVSYPVKVGGSAVIVASGGAMNIYGSTIRNNEVNTTADSNESCMQGGAIYNYGTTNVYGGTFEGNTAYVGGAIFNYRRLNIYNATIQNNTSADLGGAIYMPNSTAAYTNIGTANDVVEPYVVFSGNYGGDDGGAIYARNSLNIENTLFENNSSKGYGGAIIAQSMRLTLKNVVFRGNSSTTTAGALYVSGSNGKEQIELSAENVTFENNSGTGGGAVYLGNSTRGYFKNATFTGNSGTNAGAVYVKGSSLEIDGATFTDNTATTKAGGIYTTQHELDDGTALSSTVVLNKIEATGNSAVDGGFAYLAYTNTEIYASHFEENTASASTAVIYLATGADTKIYGSVFENNESAKNGGVITAYTYDAPVLIQDCKFLNNTCHGYGGVLHVSGRTQLTMYDITAIGNSATHGGFMYETTAGTVVKLVSITVDDNTASTGGPIIWGNTLNAKLYIDKSKMNDLDNSGAYDDAYWATAIVNKLTVYDISEDVPKYLGYNNEPYPNMQDAVDVSSSAELEAAINAGHKHIRVVDDFELDRTFYITKDMTIFSTFPYTLTRAADFGGDIFVVGEFADGTPSFIKNGTCTLTLGNPDSVQENLLTIDGNKANMTVPVVGTVVFIGFSGAADLHKNLTVINAYKNGNERVYDERYTMKPDARVGGSVAIVVSGILNVYGGNYRNNEVNPVTQAEDGSYVYNSVYGGAIYNYNNTRVYGGNFADNAGYYGGAIYSYQTLEITGGVFENNHSFSRGGAIYVVDSASAHTLIGTIPEAGKSEVIFRNNSADSNGGAIFSSQLAALVIYEGTLFDGNYSATNGGAICVYGQLTAYSSSFVNNVAENRGGAVYYSYNNANRPVRYLKFENCVFENNQGYYGGALSSYASSVDYETGGIAEVLNCTFTNNQAVKQKPGTTKAAGGAIYGDRRSQISVKDSTFIGNTAQLEGGALYAAGESVLTVENSTIDGSSSLKHGGAITVRSSYLNMKDTTVSNSQSVNNGGAIYVSYQSNREMNSKVNITGCIFENNSSTEGYGGAIYATKRTLENEHPVLTIKDTDFIGNSAKESGGAMLIASGLDAYLKNVNFSNNTSLEGKGGALYSSGGIIEYDTGVISGNHTEAGTGGAFNFEGSAVVTLNNLTATGNSAVGSSGFMHVKAGTVTLYNSMVKNNTATSSGGAIYNYGALSVYNTLFEGNEAAANGGAVVAYCGSELQMVMQDVTFLDNTATGSGGAVYASGSSLLDLYNITATGNHAVKGGFLYETTTGTVVTLNGVTLSGNTATEAPIIWGNSTGAVLKINKQNYTDSDHSGAYDDAYWASAIVNALTVEEISAAVPTYSDYVARKETTTAQSATRPAVSVDKVFDLAQNSSDAAINSTYDAFPRLDNSSNFMSNSTIVYEGINGKDVTVDTIVYPAGSATSNMNFSQGMLIYQALLYKQAHPEEEVNIHITSYRFSVQAGLCINRNSRYFGYMRQMPTTLDYDQYGFVRIAYLLVTAAKMGVNVTIVPHIDAYPMGGKNVREYFTYYMEEPCDSNYVDDGKFVSDYMTFAPVDWTLASKGGTDMMHLKLCAVSDYLDMNGVEHHNAVWTSSSNLDGIKADGANANAGQQTAIIISDHEDIYRISTNYVDLMTEYTGQEEIYEFQHILNYRSTKQAEQFLSGNGSEVPADQQLIYVGSDSDDVFELYFTPMGGSVLSWDETTNAYCKYMREMYESEDYITFVWNAAEYTGAFGLGQQMEMMINASFHENKNVNNKVYMNTKTFTGESFSDLIIGQDIGLKSFNQKEFGAIHNKDVHISYVKNGQRYYVSLMNSMNMHSGSMYYQANHMLVIKETECNENGVFFTVTDRTASGIVEHAYGEELTYPSSIDEHGYHYLLCAVCGKKKQLDTIHNSGEWVDDQNSIQHRNCTVCGNMTDSRHISEDVKLLIQDELAGVSFDQTPSTLISCPTAGSPYTFETMIYLPKTSNARAGVILGSYTGGKEDQINLEVYLNGKFRLYYKTGGSTVSYNFKTDVRSAEPQHVTLTVDGLNAVLYLNGVQVETATLTKPLPANVTNFVIGGDHRTDNAQYFRGKVLSVNLFSDVRTAEEVMQDYRIVSGTEGNLLYSAYFGVDEPIHLHTFNSLCDTDCNICGYLQDAEPHTYDGDCDVDCNVCGEVREITHTYEAVVTAPDCINGGYTTYTCDLCGDSYVADETAALGHSYDNACDVDCNVCGEVRETTHTYEAVVTAPDCVNGGYTTYTCSVCGDSYVADETEALGHSYEVVVIAPTCGKDGTTTYTCSACGDSYAETIPSTGEHAYDHAYDTDCNVCGAVREAALPVTFGGNSVSEDVNGLAFLFHTKIDGIAIKENTGNVADFTNATFGGYKLLRMGAIAANHVSQTDIAAVYVYDQSEDVTSFAYRVIDIPEDQLDTVVTMTPYFVVEVDGVEVTLYGEKQNATYRQAIEK